MTKFIMLSIIFALFLPFVLLSADDEEDIIMEEIMDESSDDKPKVENTKKDAEKEAEKTDEKAPADTAPQIVPITPANPEPAPV
ncbi:MAG TPA: hypothetical protein PKG52_00430, partial [bacterium]|nr:hypothetical protein [bacterium]